MIENSYVQKYKQQFYHDPVTVEELRKEQKMLRGLLSSLNAKINIHLEKACLSAQKKIIAGREQEKRKMMRKKASPRMTQDKTKDDHNSSSLSLPVLVTEAQIKNSKSYQTVLEK